jgi:hypothetical protein
MLQGIYKALCKGECIHTPDNQSRASESDGRGKALIYGVFDADPANQLLTVNGTIIAGNHKITNKANPENDQDAATKAYVDALMVQLYDQGVLKVKDGDGNLYNVIKIGDQLWMKENLKTTRYNDGSTIPLVIDITTWANLTTPGYCWYNNDKATYGNTYGALYNWYPVKTGKLCPAVWQ